MSSWQSIVNTAMAPTLVSRDNTSSPLTAPYPTSSAHNVNYIVAIGIVVVAIIILGFMTFRRFILKMQQGVGKERVDIEKQTAACCPPVVLPSKPLPIAIFDSTLRASTEPVKNAAISLAFKRDVLDDDEDIKETDSLLSIISDNFPPPHAPTSEIKAERGIVIESFTIPEACNAVVEHFLLEEVGLSPTASDISFSLCAAFIDDSEEYDDEESIFLPSLPIGFLGIQSDVALPPLHSIQSALEVAVIAESARAPNRTAIIPIKSESSAKDINSSLPTTSAPPFTTPTTDHDLDETQNAAAAAVNRKGSSSLHLKDRLLNSCPPPRSTPTNKSPTRPLSILRTNQSSTQVSTTPSSPANKIVRSDSLKSTFASRARTLSKSSDQSRHRRRKENAKPVAWY